MRNRLGQDVEALLPISDAFLDEFTDASSAGAFADDEPDDFDCDAEAAALAAVAAAESTARAASKTAEGGRTPTSGFLSPGVLAYRAALAD